MKKIFIIGGIILALLCTIGVYQYRLTTVTNNWKRSENNYKASEAERAGEKRVFELTLNQIMNSKDSLAKKAIELARENGIKDKRITALQYQISSMSRKDTIVIVQRDTLFLDPTTHIDTLIGDKWYQLQLGLRYPNTIITNVNFNSERYVIFNNKRETVNPPKKFFIARWFQKKHNIQEVEVYEENPYVKNKQERFINIIQ